MRSLRELVRDGTIGDVLSTTVGDTGDRWGARVDPAVPYLVDRAHGATLLTIPFAHTVDAVCHVLGEVTDSPPPRPRDARCCGGRTPARWCR